jgi:sugar O-acyltransferase (sialic acid O-acetyltransferase NeuD family)
LKLLIYGAGGYGKIVSDLIDNCTNEAYVKAEKIFVIDAEYQESLGNPVKFYGSSVMTYDETSMIDDKTDYQFVIAVGDSYDRESMYNKMLERGFKSATIIDRTARVSKTAVLGQGCLVHEYSVIDPDVLIGENGVVKRYSLVGHDSQLGNHVSVSNYAGIGGECKVGDRTYIGMGAIIREKTAVGDDAVIGMGSIILENVADHLVVAGHPAKVLRENNHDRILK